MNLGYVCARIVATLAAWWVFECAGRALAVGAGVLLVAGASYVAGMLERPGGRR